MLAAKQSAVGCSRGQQQQPRPQVAPLHALPCSTSTFFRAPAASSGPQPVASCSNRPFVHNPPAPSRRGASAVARAGLPELVFAEGYREVEKVCGVRLVVEGDNARVEYLVKWKDGSEDTWEMPNDLSEDLVRDYEEKWWAAARKADLDAMIEMLAGGREVLVVAVNEDRRSALHFAAALGNVECTKLLVEAGAEINLQDKDGYTPLHMAAGYMHTAPMTVLLEKGANPEIKDNTGRDVVQLVENLRNTMPLSIGTVQRRLALEEVGNCLIDRLYDEVAPANVLNVRKVDDGRELLVQFGDGRDDEWVHERNVSPDIVEDFDAGLEYARAACVLDVVQVGTERRFKVQWDDGYPTSWEPEENVSPELITLFRQQNPALFEERTSVEASSSRTWTEEYETQYTVGKAQQQEKREAVPVGV